MPSDTDVRAALDVCPFCGEPAYMLNGINRRTDGDGWCRQVHCLGCGAIGAEGHDDEQASGLWNARAALQPSTAISEDRAREVLAKVINDNGPVVVDFYGENLAWHPLDYGTWTPLTFARETTPPVEGAGDLLRPCDDQCGCVLCRADAYADAGYTPAPVDDISYAGAEMEDGPATHPVDAGEVERLTHVIDRDRYVAAHCLGEIEQAIARRSWLSEPGRGSYAYDDERYQQEFGAALTEIEAALAPLRRLSKDKTDCTRDEEKVRAARADAATIVSTPTASEETVKDA